MTSIALLPDSLREAVTREFGGEPVRWTGQPSARAAFLRSLPIWLFAIPWTAFALFWEVMAIGGFLGFGGPQASRGSSLGGVFVLFGLPFVAVGIGMMSAPFWMAWRARRSVWVISARRIACVTLGLRGILVRSIPPREIMSFERTELPDGSGSLKLVFGDGRDSDGDKVERSQSIEGIPEVRKVEDLLRAMASPPA